MYNHEPHNQIRPEEDNSTTAFNIEIICQIAQRQYSWVSPLLQELFADCKDLYEGRWPRYEPCQVRYHNLNHSLDVALAVARMIAGRNQEMPDEQISHELFLAGLAAALFHDTGFIKDRGDTAGHGGKYSFNHVERSIRLVHAYLQEKNWQPETIELIGRLILATDFHARRDPTGLFQANEEEIIGCMLATADLVAQMADIDYLRRIDDLFTEFQEAYRYEPQGSLTAKGVRFYSSAKEIMDGTLNFYEELVLPRLEMLGRMDRYLAAYFGDGRNPYQENIVANLSGRLFLNPSQWQRLGEVLERLGIIERAQIERAIQIQSHRKGETREGAGVSTALKHNRLMAWLNKRLASHRLGEILLDLEVIDSQKLYQGLFTQVLPPELEKTLSRADLLFLLQAAVLLQNYNQGPLVFDSVLALTARYFNCEASYIRLIDRNTGEMFVALPTTAAAEKSSMPSYHVDTGLTGWVFRHGRPMSINNAEQDVRLFSNTIAAPDSPRQRSLLVVPLYIEGERMGVLELLNKKDDNFNEHDTALATCLLNIISSVLGNLPR